MFLILEGSGDARIGNMVYPITEGDIIACPPGGAEKAHQFINTGDSDLKYLAISTKMSPEIAEYPDSGKFGVLGEFKNSSDDSPEMFRFVGRKDDSIDYWDGE